MHIHIDVDHDDVLTDNPKRLHAIRAAAYFLLHAIGDLQDLETPTAPPVAPAAMAPAANAAAASVAVNTSMTPPAPMVSVPVSNVPPPPNAFIPTSFSVPPPPPPSSAATDADYDEETGERNDFPQAGTVPPPPSVNTAAVLAPLPAPVQTAAAVLSVASVATATTGTIEYDSAGMPWDARIHQKAKGKKKDNTWKLIKGIDPAIVQAVTAELAARKGASAPVSLPQGSNSVPVPPVTNVPAPPGVPAPPASAPVSVPPPPAVGAVSASPYRALIDKITELTKAGKLAPAKVAEICQSHGAPSLMALNGMQTQMSVRDPGLTVVQGVDKDIDAAALGVL